jgi:dTDP-4-dehydrorhamnose reductase
MRNSRAASHHSSRPYRESDPVGPVNVVGIAKAQWEAAVQAAHSGSLIIITGVLFGGNKRGFVVRVTAALNTGELFAAADDLTVTPGHAPDLVKAALDRLSDGETGLYHLASPEPVTWADFARLIAMTARRDMAAIFPRPAASFGWPASRPAHTPLGSSRRPGLPPLAECVDRCLRDRA